MTRSRWDIFRFWAPLAATWLMMAAEGPFLAAVIARLTDPEFNLAAHGVAYAFAMLAEAPVIMIMSASTALVDDETSFRRLRRFTYALNALVTAALLGFLIPPIYRFVMRDLIALPLDVARLTYVALWILVPWPSAIGYRRFYQGLLIRHGRTRLVAYGTVIRLTTMATTAIVLYTTVRPPGAYVGAAALACGVVAEGIGARLMARRVVARLLSTSATTEVPSYRRILHFYYPLALTSLIGLALQPMLTFFMGRAPSPVESLAVFPVVYALTFVFRAVGLSYQEAAIALAGPRMEHLTSVNRFGTLLALATSAGLAAIALTPLAHVWFQQVSGLPRDLARFAILPTVILIPLPGLSALQSLQRAILVIAKHTAPVTWATALEIGTVALCFPLLTTVFHWPGVVSAAAAFVVGRLAAVLLLAQEVGRRGQKEVIG